MAETRWAHTITFNGHFFADCELLIDGEKPNGITSATWAFNLNNQMPTLTLTTDVGDTITYETDNLSINHTTLVSGTVN